jgi:hypothetical protein
VRGGQGRTGVERGSYGRRWARVRWARRAWAEAGGVRAQGEATVG